MDSLSKLLNWAIWLIGIAVVASIFLPQAFRVLREYQRGVIFRLGKLIGAKGPGLVFLIPFVDRMVRMDLRVITIDVQKQEAMTRDNVPVTVDAVVYFRVVDPVAAVVKVENYLKAAALIAQTTLRSVMGQSELDELLSHRDKINHILQEIIDRHTDPWGVKVSAVEVRDLLRSHGYNVQDFIPEVVWEKPSPPLSYNFDGEMVSVNVGPRDGPSLETLQQPR